METSRIDQFLLMNGSKSVILGSLGVDRFYVGDILLGILKLITAGGCGIWWFVDLFLIMGATRRKNYETILHLI